MALRVFSWVLSRPGKGKAALSGRQACPECRWFGASSGHPVMGNSLRPQQPSAPLACLPATCASALPLPAWAPSPVGLVVIMGKSFPAPCPRSGMNEAALGAACWLPIWMGSGGGGEWLHIFPGHPFSLVTAGTQLRLTVAWVVATSLKGLAQHRHTLLVPQRPQQRRASW